MLRFRRETHAMLTLCTVHIVLSVCSPLFGQYGETERPIGIRGTNQGNRAEEDSNTDLRKSYTRNDPRFTAPVFKANIRDVNDLVDPNLVVVATEIQCEKRWKTFAIGKPIQCCDDNGKLVCYHVPVAVEVNEFPELLTPPPPNEVSLTAIKDPDLWGANEFWTFVVSARETDYPIPLHYPGLPPYLVTFHKAAEEARQTLAAKSVTFSKYYSLGHRGDFYQFDAGQATQEVVCKFFHFA